MARAAYQSRLEMLPVQRAGEVEVIPAIRRHRISLPGLPAELHWVKPAGVDVRYADGSTQWVPVRDWTRIWQVGILLASLLLIKRLRRRH